jgi:hypothetical protein
MISLYHLKSRAGVIEILAIEKLETGRHVQCRAEWKCQGFQEHGTERTDGWRVKANLDALLEIGFSS